MVGRFPGASTLDQFWSNLCTGQEMISFMSDEELLANGEDPEWLKHPHYVRARAFLENIEQFDAKFFGFTPREAEIMDPQQRLFLECAHELLEIAGYTSEQYPGRIGVYAGGSMSSYLLHNLHPPKSSLKTGGDIYIGNDKDFIPTRVSYKLNLNGPSVNVNTACSSSLVAVHLACQSLLDKQSDMAMAGGVSIQLPQTGYIYQEGGILSADGHCRTFDAQATGTVDGSGVGIVLLKRLADALRDGDNIQAIIRGSAINNDGADKVGYTAPSLKGQAEVIAAAQAIANVDPETISYIETHGTGTNLGDPIEIKALTQAFQQKTHKKGFCAIGSVKTNIGHLDAAAGVTGLIKAVLSLKHGKIAPSLNFVTPNPNIDWANTPFVVNDTLTDWKRNDSPTRDSPTRDSPHRDSPHRNSLRRAGVSSFGLGGTNAHVILEEAPPKQATAEYLPWQLLTLSTKTATALDTATKNLAAHLKQHPDENLADMAYTLHQGRKAFNHRWILVCQNIEDTVNALESLDPKQIFDNYVEPGQRPIAFMFSGHGTEYINMGLELYQFEPTFRAHFDKCADFLEPILGFDLRSMVYPNPGQLEEVQQKFKQFILLQPLHFAFEYSLAQVWLKWGVHPQAMIGHSSGEYVAACLAGVFSLEDGLRLIAKRGRLMQTLPPGAMLTVSLSEEEIKPLLGQEHCLALINSPSDCVVSGQIEDIEELQRELSKKDIAFVRLKIEYAAHSYMLDPILAQFIEQVKKIELKPPQIPYLSNVTGSWITAAEATDPIYWQKHLRQTVRFGEGVQNLLSSNPESVLLEIGPGRMLATLTRRFVFKQVDNPTQPVILSSIRQAKEPISDTAFLLTTLGQLWLAGIAPDWSQFWGTQHPRRIPLPTYPFERQSYWIDPPQMLPIATENSQSQVKDSLTDLIDSVEEPANRLISSAPRLHLTSAHKAPSSSTEHRLATIWQQFLGIQEIGIQDNFFGLGGHSLLGTQLISRVRDSLGITIPLATLFEAPTIAEMALWIDKKQAVKTILQAQNNLPIPIEVFDRDKPLPLSFAQQRLWFIDQFEGPSPTYNLPLALRLTGELNVIALETAINEIVQRHEVLRTTFPAVDGRARQQISATLHVPLQIVNLKALAEAEQNQSLQNQLSEAAGQPFDLASGALLRVILYQLSESEYVLFFNKHHIISDGWSLGVFMTELSTLYQAFSAGLPSPLSPLAIQYADFAVWQRDWLQGEVLSQQLAYWQSQLANAPTLLDLPTDYPRPPQQSFKGGMVSFEIESKLVDELKKLSRTQGVTLFMTLYADFAILLSRYSGQDDIVIGSPIANRHYQEIEPLIGFFVNTLALRADLSGQPTFTELLSQVRQTTLEAYSHQDLPFERLVSELDIPRNLSHSPLFQVMLAFNNTPTGFNQLGDIEVSPVEFENNIAKFDLTLHVTEVEAELMVALEYNADLFEAATIERMAGHLQTLLRGIVANPEQLITELPMLTEPERQQILIEWNNTQTNYPTDKSIHHLFEQQVEQTPDAVAVVFGDEQLTYEELNQRANQLAHYLQTLGVGPEVLVGICVERSIKMVVGLLGILKAGGAYVPLDPTYPAERLVFMLQDAELPLLLSQEHLQHSLPATSAQIVCLDGDWDDIAKYSSESPMNKTKPDNLAYMIYTSGSTGQPKGTMNYHKSIFNRLVWMQDMYKLTTGDKILQKTPFSFDVSVWEFFWPLMYGATLVVARPEGHKDPQYLVEIIKERKITTVHFVPSMLQIFIEAEEVMSCTSLKRIICSGEALPYKLMQRCLSKLPAELHNLYGPTEAAVDVSYWRCLVDYKKQIVPIGRPIANTQLYILDTIFQPMPIGVAGELYIGGIQLARGYLNRHKLTAEKFIPNPFGEGRLYKTGDLARWLPDGNIEFIGRIDHQVKIRGFRIELGEIEAVLGQHAAVQEVVVLAREDDPGHKRLVAYLVASGKSARGKSASSKSASGKSASSKSASGKSASLQVAGGQVIKDDMLATIWRTYLGDKLPDYMVPSAFVMLEQFPLTPNGKIDRKALPEPDSSDLVTSSEFAPPQTPTEEIMAAVWAEVLGLEQVGRFDNFFDLGGHSLLATQVISRLQTLFEVKIAVRMLFEKAILNELSEQLDIELLLTKTKPNQINLDDQEIWEL